MTAHHKGREPMRLLFTIDPGDCDPAWRAIRRPSARGILIREGRIAMVHSLQYDYYKFPGGGIEPGESREAALIRETREEAGLVVIPSTIRPYGMVRRIQKWSGLEEAFLLQDNYYYLCGAKPEPVSQRLDDYEAAEGFSLAWVRPETAVTANRRGDHGPKDPHMLEREARVLEMLAEEGYFA